LARLGRVEHELRLCEAAYEGDGLEELGPVVLADLVLDVLHGYGRDRVAVGLEQR